VRVPRTEPNQLFDTFVVVVLIFGSALFVIYAADAEFSRLVDIFLRPCQSADLFVQALLCR